VTCSPILVPILRFSYYADLAFIPVYPCPEYLYPACPMKCS
jgi:hypothetical protein